MPCVDRMSGPSRSGDAIIFENVNVLEFFSRYHCQSSHFVLTCLANSYDGLQFRSTNPVDYRSALLSSSETSFDQRSFLSSESPCPPNSKARIVGSDSYATRLLLHPPISFHPKDISRSLPLSSKEESKRNTQPFKCMQTNHSVWTTIETPAFKNLAKRNLQQDRPEHKPEAAGRKRPRSRDLSGACSLKSRLPAISASCDSSTSVGDPESRAFPVSLGPGDTDTTVIEPLVTEALNIKTGLQPAADCCAAADEEGKCPIDSGMSARISVCNLTC